MENWEKIAFAYCSQWIWKLSVDHPAWLSFQSGTDWNLDMAHRQILQGPLQVSHKTNWNELKEKILEDLGHQIKFTWPGQPDYPKALLQMSDPPLYLSYLGMDHWSHQPCWSVVGSRSPSAESILWLEQEMPQVLQRLQLVTVSGGARGVDETIHSLCIRQSRPTVVVLPSGLQDMYPGHWQESYSQLIALGVSFISEFSPRQKMMKSHFESRNRIIAGLSVATLIVEGRVKSGTLLTARHCISMGRDLLVLPDHPIHSRSKGSLSLLLEGAHPVMNAEDLCSLLGSNWVHPP